MKLKGNTIVITGGSSGIGLELSKVLTKQGNQVIICGRSSEKLERARQMVSSLHIFRCDLSQAPERNRFSEWIEKNYPQCNILINNAAIVHKANFFSDSEIVGKAELETQTNFIAPVALTKLFFPILRKNENSKIIYITTGLVYTPKAAYPIYCATKAALHSFIQTLRMQATEQPIDFLEVLMPAVDTPFHDGNPPKLSIGPQKAVEEMLNKLEKGTKEIKVGSVKILHPFSRVAPNFAIKKVNSL
jgi:uncharacterized oxidoreductase